MKQKREIEGTKKLGDTTEQVSDLINIEANITKSAIQNTIQTGKCPIHIRYNEGKTQRIDLKEPYSTQNLCILQDLTATKDKEIANNIVHRGVGAMPDQDRIEHNFNTIFQSLSDSAPSDSTEAKLCLQSTVLYAQGMRHIEKAENCDRIDHSEYYMKNAVKLLRLHNETIETLSRYRRGGEQKVIVQHVQVNDGGQAIVGGMVNGGGGKIKNNEVIPC